MSPTHLNGNVKPLHLRSGLGLAVAHVHLDAGGLSARQSDANRIESNRFDRCDPLVLERLDVFLQFLLERVDFALNRGCHGFQGHAVVPRFDRELCPQFGKRCSEEVRSLEYDQ